MAKDRTVEDDLVDLFSETTTSVALAKYLYERYGDEIYSDQLRTIGERIASKEEFVLHNDTYVNALLYTDLMLQNTSKSLYVFAGKEGDGFLSTLSKSFKDAMGRIRDNKGQVKVIGVTTSETESTFLNEIKEQFPDNFEIKPLIVEDKTQLKHFIVADKKHSRVEELHAELSPKTNVKEIKAEVAFNNSTKGEFLTKFFEELWAMI